jgi:DNA ligase-1
MQPNAVLDGELYNHDLRDDFEQIISLVRKQKPTDEDRLNAHKLIQYHVYDMVAEGPSYEDRLNWLLSSKNLWSDSVISVDTLEVHGYNGAEVVHKVWVFK